MEYVWIAALVMISAVLIVNLGLGEAIAKIAERILQCPICLTFWASFVALLFKGCDPIVAASLSIFAAYLSNFVGIALMMFNRLYDWLYGKEAGKRKPDTSDSQDRTGGGLQADSEVQERLP